MTGGGGGGQDRDGGGGSATPAVLTSLRGHLLHLGGWYRYPSVYSLETNIKLKLIQVIVCTGLLWATSKV